jgi:hypothetical protein
MAQTRPPTHRNSVARWSSDINMPTMTRFEVLQRLTEIAPQFGPIQAFLEARDLKSGL